MVTQSSCRVCDRVKVALMLWVLALMVTLPLSIVSVATWSWMSWTDSALHETNEFGLFYDADITRPSCVMEDITRETEESVYLTFSVDAVAGLVITGIIVDAIAFVLGFTYFYIRGKEKVKLWRFYIPTSVAALSAAAFILIGCLVFVDDMSDALDGPMIPRKDASCQTDVSQVRLTLEYGWSFYLSLVCGGVCCVKGIVFALVSCWC
ncbi:unnamed protein product [Lymnaea stagnalis]|uniref:Uncharacterized protein n=1 Tax=Lymnaea stagnalis TaxID=6523 RepID=A0AAV2HMZ5_LYMST